MKHRNILLTLLAAVLLLALLLSACSFVPEEIKALETAAETAEAVGTAETEAAAEARHIDPDQDFSLWYNGLRSPMTEEEIAFFLDFLAHVEHTDLQDQTAMDIAREEAEAFLTGLISAEEAASRTQKRMSLYVSEQG